MQPPASLSSRSLSLSLALSFCVWVSQSLRCRTGKWNRNYRTINLLPHRQSQSSTISRLSDVAQTESCLCYCGSHSPADEPNVVHFRSRWQRDQLAATNSQLPSSSCHSAWDAHLSCGRPSVRLQLSSGATRNENENMRSRSHFAAGRKVKIIRKCFGKLKVSAWNRFSCSTMAIWIISCACCGFFYHSNLGCHCAAIFTIHSHTCMINENMCRIMFTTRVSGVCLNLTHCDT